MSKMASQITSLTIVYSTVYSGVDQRKHQSSTSLAFVRGIHRWPMNSPHKGPVTRKMFPFDDVVMSIGNPTVEIRRSYDRLISTMRFPILVRWHLYIESGTRRQLNIQFPQSILPWGLNMAKQDIPPNIAHNLFRSDNRFENLNKA